MKRGAASALAACVAANLAMGAAFAQTSHPRPDSRSRAEPKPASKSASKPAPKPEPAPSQPAALDSAAPPYEAPLLRLSELLGALSYLRDLCGHADGAEFRARMATLLDSEAASGPRRDRIAGYFNRGFREYELLHRTCTPVSREVMRRAMGEAGTLARDIGSRYGGT